MRTLPTVSLVAVTYLPHPMKLQYGVFSFIFVVSLSPALLAWGKAGHMATGSVAYRELSANASTAPVAAAVAKILESHPFTATEWKAELAEADPVSVSRAERLFVLAAQWPDEVRDDPWQDTYHHGDWHYVNITYTPGKAGPGPELKGKILPELVANLKVVADKKAKAADRAIAVSWVLHLVGDVHQPLHVVALVTVMDPNGDAGGNDFFVRTKAENQPVKLHSLWDRAGVKSDTDFAGVSDNAVKLRAAFPSSDLPELKAIRADDFNAIAAKETYVLAVKYAYLNGKLKGSDEHIAEEKPTKVPVLPSDYLNTAGEISKRQQALAGYRLAALFKGAKLTTP